jgi:hypothetical protein
MLGFDRLRSKRQRVAVGVQKQKPMLPKAHIFESTVRSSDGILITSE